MDQKDILDEQIAAVKSGQETDTYQKESKIRSLLTEQS